jgi:hypothetical protein
VTDRPVSLGIFSHIFLTLTQTGKIGYGGTADDPTFGLGQGNGMAPSGFSVVSSLMVGAFTRLGHASSFAGVWTGILFTLAAIIYVDDTDLLLRASSRDISDGQFYNECQTAVTDWGHIVLASGGYLKAAKCFWYMMSWKWVRGVPQLRSLQQLPKYELYIPQKVGAPATVSLRDVSDAAETLGVWSCPAGDFGFPVSKKMDEGHLWVERLRRNRCPAADGWLGFQYSLIPKVTYGFAAITVDPNILEKSFQKLYREVLSPLKVNKNITRFYRMAPKRVMGLGMPNPCIKMLSHKLHLLQCEWNQPTAAGQMLQQSLEVFQMETGFTSNILERDYSRYSSLATDGWWKQLWNLCCRYDVKLQLGSKWLIPLLRVGDRAIMEVICSTDIFTKAQWAAINRVRRYKGLHSIADLVFCDGRTINPWVLNTEPSRSTRVFSVEKPTRSDFTLFRRAVEFLSSPSHVLPHALGAFVGKPHAHEPWYANEDMTELYLVTSDSTYTCYTRDASSRASRYGKSFADPVQCTGQCPRHTHVSVHHTPHGTVVTAHSTAAAYSPPAHKRTFLERIRALPNQSLWKNFTVDGDGSWIYEALLSNSLVMMSDGSYDPLLAEDVCSCAAMVECSVTGRRASLSWVEKSDRLSADNYRAEILGGIALQMLVSVACDMKYISPSMKPHFGCDNNGVVYHGNHPHRPLPAKQAQADVLRYYRQLVQSAPFKCKMYHVHGHLDRYLSYAEMTPSERLNCDCDKLAGAALHAAVEQDVFISRFLPGEDLVVNIASSKITGSYEKAITRHWGDNVGREHYCSGENPIISPGLFDDVYWDGLEKVLGSSSEMFSVWATKQVSGFCGNNHLLHHINGVTVDKCPNCGCHPERAEHIIFCRDPARSAVFDSSVDKLVEWLSSQRTDPRLTDLLSTYLRRRGDVYMSSLCNSRSPYYELAEMVDLLGFRNILEGRIPKLFYVTRQEDIKRRRLSKHAGHWCNGLILRLLQITHRQWTFRNGTVHLRGPDGLTKSQQDALARRCEELLWVDPCTLLEEDRYLLEINFDELGDGSSACRQAWISEMEAARAAASYAASAETDDISPESSPWMPVPVDTEGSIRFRRRRRRRSGIIEHTVVQLPRSWKRILPLMAPCCCSATVEKKGYCPLLSCN